MIRKYEKESTWKAGMLAIAVHVVLFGALLISFNWKAAHPVLNVAEVELWDSLPSAAPPAPPVVEHKVEPKPEPKVEPPPVVEEKPEPKVAEPKVEEPKVDIALEKKKAEKLELDKLKKEQELEKKKLLDALRKEDLDVRPDNSKQLKEKKAKEDALNALKNDISADGEKQVKIAKSAASKGVVDQYVAKMRSKIQGNVNSALCGTGDPILKFNIGLHPTGELNGNPRLTKSSGMDACDAAIERAIIASQPFAMPSEAELKSEFRDIDFTFTPNR